MTIDECLEALAGYDQQCKSGLLPSLYYDEIAHHWFTVIAPDKTREYGTECWERLGPRGFVVNMSAMRYRWTQLVANGRSIGDPAMLNCLVDAFGFSMLFNLCLGIPILSFEANSVVPRVDDEWIITNLWDKQMPLTAEMKVETGMRALRMAHVMWVAA
jgi:hypothetical protein